MHRRCSRRKKERARPYSRTLPSLILLVAWPLLLSVPTPTAGFLIAAAAAMSASGSSGMGLGDIGGQQQQQQQQQQQGGVADQPQQGEEEACSIRPLWRRDLEAALEKNKEDVHSRFLQLATVRVHDDGQHGPVHKPHVRWAVFRGFLDGSDSIAMVTDARSEKVRDLQANPHAELAWYFIASREQFRVEGIVRVVTEATSEDNEEGAVLAAARRKFWATMSDAARLQFAWPEPGAPQPAGEGVDPAVFLSPTPPPPRGDEPPPATFVLLVVDPERVDHLQLRPSPQVRRVHSKGRGKDAGGEKVAGWATVAVNP